MEQITVKMFVNTCDYMTHLLEEIMSSSSEIPKDTFLSLNDLMAKLLSFMSHVYRHNSQANLPAQTRINTDVSKSMHIHPQAPTSTFNTTMAQPHQYGNPMPQVLTGYRFYQMSPLMNVPFNQLSNSHGNFNNNNRNLPNQFQNHYQPFHQQAPVLTTNNPPNVGFARNTTPTIIPANFSSTAPFSTVNTNTPANAQSSFVPPQPINILPTNDSSQLNNEPSKCEVPITDLFAMFLSSLSNSTTIGLSVKFYCQLCDLMCSPWSSHINDVIHKEKRKDVKKPKMKSCRICGLYLYGKKSEIIQYFKYHFEKIHLESNELCTNWEDAVISVDSAQILAKELQFDKDSSISKSSNNADSDKLKLKKTKNKKTVSGIPNSTGQNTDSAEENKIVNAAGSAIPALKNYSSPSHDKVSAPGEVSTHSEIVSSIKNTVSTHTGSVSPQIDAVLTDTDAVLIQTDEISTLTDEELTHTDKVLALSAKNHEDTLSSNSSPFPQFDLLIKVMAEEWTKSSILMDVGFCDVCQLGIKSAFDWFSHTSDHNSTGDASWKEEICPRCQVKVYGLDHQKYFNLISHCKLDEMIG